MNTWRTAKAFILAVVASLGAAALAQGPAPAPAASRPPIVINLATETTTVAKDGLYTQVSHFEISPTNDAAANRVAQEAFAFSEATEELEVTEAYTLKADGKKLPVDASHIFVQAPEGASQAPMFNDLKRKVVVFPDVAANDTIVFTLTKRAKETLFPGEYFAADLFPRLTAFNEVQYTITAPKSLPLTIEAHDVTTDRQTQGDNVIYSFHYSAPVPLTEDVAAVAPIDREPRLFASAFKDYDELGHAFAALALPKAAVTPKIQALADETTMGISDRRAQSQRLYEWVSKHIRYVGIELGSGRVVPHDADTVVNNGYGDCKDHVALFAALLQAKGISSEMVLINAGNSYLLSSAPTLAQLNHVITWIPELKMYADTTAATAPFGTLPFVEYGKPVIHAVRRGPTRHTIPLLAAGEATMSLKTVSQIQPDGKLRGDTTITATGPFSAMLRQTGMAVQAAGSERAVTAILQQGGLTGTGTFDPIPPPSELGPNYTLTAHFSAQPQAPYTSGQGFPIPPGLRLLPFAGDYLAGPLFTRNLAASESTPCWSGTEVEELSIEPPPGRHFAKLPQDTTVNNDSVSFSAHWSQTGRIISVRREFTSKMNQPLCNGAIRQAVAEALPRIAAAYPLQIMLADD